MTHFLSRHGRFLYLTETLRLSQYNGQQGHPEWEVKIRDIGNIPLFKLKLIPSIQIAWLPGVIKTSSRTVLETFETQELNENNSYPISSKIGSKFCEDSKQFSFNFAQILSISLILTSHSGWPCYPLYWLNIRVSVRYRNRPCLGRKWVIGHQILWNISPYKSLLENLSKN